LEQLVEENDDQPGNDQLHDQQDADAEAKLRRGTIEAGKDVDTRLAERNDDGKNYGALATTPLRQRGAKCSRFWAVW
jgi:hypothetical protein